MAAPIKCLVSYTWTGWQKAFAKRFAEELRDYPDLDVWIDTEQISPGDRLYERVERGLRRESDCCICLLSSEYLQRENCKKELSLAHALCFHENKPLFPVKLGDCDMPFELRDMVYHNLSAAVSEAGEVDELVFHALVKDLVDTIRKKFEPKADLITFFDPKNSLLVKLVTDRTYQSPFAEKDHSTTEVFAIDVAEVLRTLERRKALKGWGLVHTDYMEPSEWKALIEDDFNLISYASSKINPCTDLILRHLERSHSVRLRFVLESDLDHGAHESVFPNRVPNQRVALFWEGMELRYLPERDHCLILRARPTPKDGRVWWVFAGCGRPGSVAARKLVFEPAWSTVFWDYMSGQLPDSFIAVFSVDYDSMTSHEPINPRCIEFRSL